VHINTYGTGKTEDVSLAKAVQKVFDLTPAGIIDRFDLKRPIYRDTAAYGHFGRPNFPWEELNYTDKIANAL
ncbi:MAG TPA: methionine adenosyltransferase domain-containing protein, partial [Fodinibius sp.]|nr:methionine adenosyltransferase domain-containing protein [Fodinibius sp.]